MNLDFLRAALTRGESLTAILSAPDYDSLSKEEKIAIIYDLQAGSYIRALENPATVEQKHRLTSLMAAELRALGWPSSLLDAGVGEGTTLAFLLEHLREVPAHLHGVDVSWSRLAVARQWLSSRGHPDVFLACGSLRHLPYQSGSFDVVMTCHALEPNGGQEKEILAELYRVAARYLVLFEPCQEHCQEQGRARMRALGYINSAAASARELGMNVERHEVFYIHPDKPLNPTSFTLISKSVSCEPAVPVLSCPRDLSTLSAGADACFSHTSGLVYPKVGGIPCLLPGNAILASHYPRG